MKEEEQFIERRIITGLIISTEYLESVRKIWSSKLLGSAAAKMIANWCIEFYDEYHTAPSQEIESIFLKKSKKIKKADKQDIEEILSSLSDEYEHQDKFNVAYLLDQTTQYFDECNLKLFIDDISNELDQGNILQAKKAAYAYTPSIAVEDKDIDLSSPSISEHIKKAFATTSQPVVKYPRQLGEFLNEQLVRGGFVSFMSSEKRGKTWLMLDLAIRAARQGANVAFFQAGDMTQEQQLMRTSIYLTKKSNKERYSGKMYEPVRDCIYNQLDDCKKKERECDFGIFEGKEISFLRKEITKRELKEAADKNPDYRPCHNCSPYWKKPWGSPWLKKVNTGDHLSVQEATKAIEKFFGKNNRRFKLSTHANKTLSISKIDNILDVWERRDGFIVDMIMIDYMDIVEPEIGGDFRHQENDKWMRARGLGQKRHALLISATQTDTDSYEKIRLGLKNFSEDKRKYAHVTAMYGINQDPKGREKEIGIMRLNEIVVREGEFLISNEVHVLQNLKRGQPCLSSYW